MMVACTPSPPEGVTPDVDMAPPASVNVGSEACADCHESQYLLWRGSHHQLAMQEASPASVLGRFEGQSLSHSGATSVFSTIDSRYYIKTPDSDGVDQTFEITHTFGVTPLQQYLVATQDGKKQALQYAWDSRSAQDGGQRWFHLYPDENIPPGDPLHWTGRYFNWNFMCAECHSTNVHMNYSMTGDSFDTQFDEVSVGCEACHGPGSRHIAQASNDNLQPDAGLAHQFSERKNAAWFMNTNTGIAQRNPPHTTQREVEACGRCHARRSVTAAQYEFGQPLTQTHLPALLEDGLYHADGRILDEVYVYGSFVQSKMYQAGVTCSDCHEPHSGTLRAGPNPNDTCAQCHSTSRFASSDHSETKVGECVTCHMPATTYMQIDDRRDHSFRLPGTADDPDHYGAILAAGRAGPANPRLLEAIANQPWPTIVSATALSMVGPAQDASEAEKIVAQLSHDEPLMRVAGLRALRRQPPRLKLQAGSELLGDNNRAVRIEAAQTFSEVRDYLPPSTSKQFGAAANDYREFMSLNVAMPEAAVRLAEFESRLGQTAAASALYLHALELDPNFDAAHHSYGLHLVRQRSHDEAIEHLARAATLAPDVARYAYVYGVALNSMDRSKDAIRVLQASRTRFPEHFDIAWALVTVLRDHGERATFLNALNDLLTQYPDNQQVRALVSSSR